jgi:hypothetical protein
MLASDSISFINDTYTNVQRELIFKEIYKKIPIANLDMINSLLENGYTFSETTLDFIDPDHILRNFLMTSLDEVPLYINHENATIQKITVMRLGWAK